MHVTIMALGSFGDVYPFVLLGAALRRAGCEVRLATFEGFAELAVKHALSFHAVEGDAAALMQGSAGVALAEAGLNIGRMLSGVRESFGA
jgi:sterol 3beta-glucosyltransferase